MFIYIIQCSGGEVAKSVVHSFSSTSSFHSFSSTSSSIYSIFVPLPKSPFVSGHLCLHPSCRSVDCKCPAAPTPATINLHLRCSCSNHRRRIGDPCSLMVGVNRACRSTVVSQILGAMRLDSNPLPFPAQGFDPSFLFLVGLQQIWIEAAGNHQLVSLLSDILLSTEANRLPPTQQVSTAV
jgi:hypothetical protein